MWTYSVRISWDGVTKEGDLCKDENGNDVVRPWKDVCQLVSRRWACRSDNT